MKNCRQNQFQTIFEHGVSVQKYYFEFKNLLEQNNTTSGHRLPDWFFIYRNEILGSVLNDDVVKNYTLFHDCGKPYCIEYDENGKIHFPNHANKSFEIWSSCGGDPIVAELIRRDMEIHTIKDKDVKEFARDQSAAITLLLVGLSEVHSNAQMFGGQESDSFKIKYKQISKRGRAVCDLLFKGENK